MDNQFNLKRKEIHEECKEFGRMFREKLQEFAMILTKEYHYNFPVEYFDDYRGSFKKEEFLGAGQPKEKSRLWETDSLPILDFGQKKKHFDEDSSEKKNGYNIRDDIGWERHNFKEKSIKQLARAADQKEPTDLFEGEAGKEGNFSKHKEDVAGLPTWKQEMLAEKAVKVVLQPRKELIHLDVPKEGRLDIGVPKATNQVLQEADEVAVEEEDGDVVGVLQQDQPNYEEESVGQTKHCSDSEEDEEMEEEAEEEELEDGIQLVGSFSSSPTNIEISAAFTSTDKVKLLSIALRKELMADYVFKVETNLDWTVIVGGDCSQLESNQVVSIEDIGQIMLGMDLGNLRMKKKRPRRIKKEGEMKPIEKAGIG